MQDGRKAVGSIPYVSVAFFTSLKQNFIAYRYSKMSDCHQALVECIRNPVVAVHLNLKS